MLRCISSWAIVPLGAVPGGLNKPGILAVLPRGTFRAFIHILVICKGRVVPSRAWPLGGVSSASLAIVPRCTRYFGLSQSVSAFIAGILGRTGLTLRGFNDFNAI